MSFRVSGRLRGRPVSVEWLPPPGDPPGLRWTGDGELVTAIAETVASSRSVWSTPTGPTFIAADDPPHVALVTALFVLDEVGRFASGDVPTIPGLAVPDGATP